MKTIQYTVFSIIALGFTACGTDPEIESTNTKKDYENNGAIIPEAKIKAPGSKWIGSTEEFGVIFVELDSTAGGSLNYRRLFVRADDRPYTGSINRLYLSGTTEFSGNYEKGYLEGLAYRWRYDGSFDYSIRVKRGMIVEDATINEGGFQVHAEEDQEDAVVSSEPIFVGSYDNLAEWTKVVLEEEIEYLLDKRTGRKVTGGLKVHNKDGTISYYSEYKDGKLHGRNEKWHDNGVKSTDSNYANGVKHGLETWRDEESGLKTWEANYLNGKQHELETTWDENGTILFQRSYQNGQLVTPNQ